MTIGPSVPRRFLQGTVLETPWARLCLDRRRCHAVLDGLRRRAVTQEQRIPMPIPVYRRVLA